MTINREMMMRSARKADADSKQAGGLQLIANYGINVGDMIFVAGQRALRGVLRMRRHEKVEDVDQVIDLTPEEQELYLDLKAMFMDGFINGVLSTKEEYGD